MEDDRYSSERIIVDDCVLNGVEVSKGIHKDGMIKYISSEMFLHQLSC